MCPFVAENSPGAAQFLSSGDEKNLVQKEHLRMTYFISKPCYQRVPGCPSGFQYCFWKVILQRGTDILIAICFLKNQRAPIHPNF